jgi:ribosomal protein S15P/S13E
LGKLGFDIETVDNKEEELKIHLYGNAEDDVELIVVSINKLIEHLKLHICRDDQERFNEEMNKILLAIEQKPN